MIATRRERLRIPADATLAIGLGYADLRKGFDLFLQSWRMAHAADPSIHFLWVGDIDPGVAAYLGAEMAAAEATGTFHHQPFQAQGGDWLAAADVLAQLPPGLSLAADNGPRACVVAGPGAAIDAWEATPFARETFGEHFADNYAALARYDLTLYEAFITDWETQRYREFA